MIIIRIILSLSHRRLEKQRTVRQYGVALITIDDNEIETWISCSQNFRKENEEKIPFDMFYDLEKSGKESPL